MRSYAVACLSVVLLLALSSCTAPAPEEPTPTSILITPAGVLLTPDLPSQTLSAVVLDQHGEVMDLSVEWSSSAPDAVQVSGAGGVTAVVAAGSATITASAGTASAQVAAIAAVPAAGTVLVSDADVLTGPTPVDPSQTFGEGALYTVTLNLANVATPDIGAHLLATGAAPVAGRVVDVAGNTVTLEIVPLEELFVELDIDQSLDLSTAPLLEEAGSGLTVERLPDGSWRAHGAITTGESLTPQAEFEVGNLECESDFNFAELDVLNVDVSFTPALSFDVAFSSTQKKVVLNGRPKVVATLEPVIKAGLQGSVECDLTIANIQIPLPGPIGLFLGVVVPVGVGFELQGSVPLADFGYHFEGEVGAELRMGFDCDPTCEPVTVLDPHVTGSHRPLLPNDLLGLKLESSLFAYLFAGLEAGVRFSPKLRIEVAKGKVGLQLEGKFASEDTQFADTGFAAEYGLDFVATIGAGKDIDAFFDLISVNLAELAFTLTGNIATSPKASSVSADVEAFSTGDTVTFTVTLDPASLDFPIVGYNITSMRVYNALSGSLVLANEETASAGQKDFEITWVASQDGEVADDFVVFVTTKLLPELRLELGEASDPGGGGTATLNFSTLFERDFSQELPNWEETLEETRSLTGQYSLNVLSRSANAILFEVVSGNVAYGEDVKEVTVEHGKLGNEANCTYSETTEFTYQASGNLSVPAGTPGTYRVTLLDDDQYYLEFYPDLFMSVPYQETFKVSGGCGVDGIDDSDSGLSHESSGFGSPVATLDPDNPNVLSGHFFDQFEDTTDTVTWTLTITPP